MSSINIESTLSSNFENLDYISKNSKKATVDDHDVMENDMAFSKYK